LLNTNRVFIIIQSGRLVTRLERGDILRGSTDEIAYILQSKGKIQYDCIHASCQYKKLVVNIRNGLDARRTAWSCEQCE